MLFVSMVKSISLSFFDKKNCSQPPPDTSLKRCYVPICHVISSRFMSFADLKVRYWVYKIQINPLISHRYMSKDNEEERQSNERSVLFLSLYACSYNHFFPIHSMNKILFYLTLIWLTMQRMVTKSFFKDVLKSIIVRMQGAKLICAYVNVTKNFDLHWKLTRLAFFNVAFWDKRCWM